MFVLDQFGVGLNVFNLSLVLVCLLIAGTARYFVVGTNIKIPRPTYKNIGVFIKNLKLNPLDVLIVLTILGFVVRSLVVNYTFKPETWDTISLYDYRALRFSESKSLAKGSLTTGLKEEVSYNYSYPFMTSLSHAIVYIYGGDNPRFVYTFFYASLVGAAYFILRRSVSRRTALLLTAMLALSPEIAYHSVIEYTNLPYTVYFGLGSLYILEWIKDKNWEYINVGSVFIGLSVWVRNQEPFWLIPLILVIVVMIVERKLKILEFLILGLTILIFKYSWTNYVKEVFESINWQDSQIVNTSIYFDFRKIYPSIQYAIENIFLTRKAPTFLLLSVISYLLFVTKKISKIVYPLAFLLLCVGMIFVGTYFYSINFSWWDKIGGSVSRMTLFFPVLVVYITAQAFPQKLKKTQK
jgi:hypothetical protein